MAVFGVMVILLSDANHSLSHHLEVALQRTPPTDGGPVVHAEGYKKFSPSYSLSHLFRITLCGSEHPTIGLLLCVCPQLVEGRFTSRVVNVVFKDYNLH